MARFFGGEVRLLKTLLWKERVWSPFKSCMFYFEQNGCVGSLETFEETWSLKCLSFEWYAKSDENIGEEMIELSILGLMVASC